MAGGFIWTGFDYRGEPNPFNWPAVASQTGAMDMAGFPKPAYYYWRSWWRSKPSVYAFPDWDFPKSMVGKDILVRAYSNCERVELEINGRSYDMQKMPPYKYVEWHVPYAPGELEVIGYNHGREVAKYAIHTAGPAASLRLTNEVHELAADGESVAPIAVAVVDAHGRVVPEAGNNVRVSVSGAGTLVGTANGNPASHVANLGGYCKAFHGLCMVMVKAGDRAGNIVVHARAQGLTSATMVIHAVPTPPGA